MADNTTRIEQIDAILEAGADEVVIDGTKVRYDFDTLRAERDRLIAADDTRAGSRPRSSAINLG